MDSFLRTTWFQVPDQSSKTRIMRPQFKKRSNLSASNATQIRNIGIQVPAESPHPPGLSVAESTKAEEIDGADKNLSDIAEQDHSSSITSSADTDKEKDPSSVTSSAYVDEQEDSAFVASSAVYVSIIHVSPQMMDRPNLRNSRCHFFLFQH